MPVAAASLTPGTLVLGRYRPIRPLGSGGAGSVWLARDERSGLDVALKIVAREGMTGTRAEREAATAAQLRHERCVRAYGFGRDAEHVYIAYEYVRGRSMRHAMREGELDDRRLLEASAQILDGLAHAHTRGVVHRDVKPANVLLESGPRISAKILDFGLALIREDETLTAVGDIPGTLAYISPERLRGEKAGPAADVWSVGVMLWEGLAGTHPFWGGTLLETAKLIDSGAPPLRTQRPDLPKQLLALVDAALAVDPRRRPSAARLAAALRQALAARPRRKRASRRRPAISLSLGPFPTARVVPAAPAALFAGFAAGQLPFFPAGWWAGLALVSALLAALDARAGLAFALAVPVLPLGNESRGLALVYAAVAAAWLVGSWRQARVGLVPVLGPVLAAAGLLGFLPVAAQLVRRPLRRAMLVAAGSLLAALVGALPHRSELGVDGMPRPLPVAEALVRTLERHPGILLEAVALAICSALLPLARGRGPWAAAGFGAAMVGLTVLASPGAPALPTIGAAWLIAAGLAAEPYVRHGMRREAAAGG